MEKSVLKRLAKGDISVFTDDSDIETVINSNTFPVISNCKQSDVLDKLQNLIPFEQFYMVIDARTYCIKEVRGFEKWLGYNERNLTMENYFKMISDEQLLSRNLYSYVLLKKMLAGVWKFDFMNQHTENLFSIKNYNGE